MTDPSSRRDSYIDGEWCPAGDGARYPVHDPADGSVITEFAAATIEDCLDAVEAAERARPAWAARAPRERSEILRAAFELMTAEAETMTELIIAENGKAYADAKAEAGYAIEFFRWFAEEAVRIGGDYRLAPAGDKRIVVTQQPIGVSVLITPWNFPAAMATRKLGPALAAGCPVILKPAAETPLTAAYVVDALARAGVPRGVVNLVTPEPPGPAVAAMLHHEAVRKLSFTGSTEVGRELLRQSADQVVDASMELGGNAPFLVLPGADVDDAVAGAMIAKLRNGGAACTAANRFYVHRSLLDEFTTKITTAMSEVRLGPGRDPSNTLGALVSDVERDKVAGLVDRAVADGAELIIGGPVEGPGAFYRPTVLTGVRHGTEITTTEIFGPVVTIIGFDEIDEAVALANDTIFGLISYVYGERGQALAVAERLDSGMVAVNRGVVSDPAAPFGGMKQSGLGREGGFAGIEEFLETKYIGL
ncbi:NAD-dependent succinate-semialdehyde dehydrogenase [Microlunatus parietis]|uniref:Succinate-semialdehyde dehydrogenase/glutarate-semialdehyde dehydrogenase n=1 Tax=Microlunatus parietis TaxID=682979 RepID=A0A7Y9IBD4_9ACTN|nr:NAD-dependent succinate-semialdehyde dehydrogenase [Microlunatus parietis]NYE73734.1 succinate-semialdehyde dehydrogenase/glutarate-semialdehyde dehydrogenase [Microlunatus parietis]